MNPMTDKFDLLILAELQQDARLPIPELAHRVGLSAPACYRRLRTLREAGLIEREVALVALELELALVALVVLALVALLPVVLLVAALPLVALVAQRLPLALGLPWPL